MPKPSRTPRNKLPQSIVDLQRYYAQTEARLVKIITEQAAKGNSTLYRKRILAQVQAEIAKLDRFAEAWVRGVITAEYAKSAAAVYRYLDRAIPAAATWRNSAALNVIIDNAIGELKAGHNYIGRRIDDELRQAVLDASAAHLSVGDTIRQTRQNMLDIMTQRGITSIRDKRGRMIKLDNYALLIARTTVTEAVNTATINENLELDNDLVQLTNHFASCPVCGPLEGRVFSISGKDARYPKLSQCFPDGYTTIHPNCGHVLAAYYEKSDPDPEQTRKFSQRPINQDARSKASIDRYNAVQDKNRELRRDLAQWEKYKAALPDSVPKTLAGFRRMKQSGNQNWQDLQSDYRHVISQINQK